MWGAIATSTNSLCRRCASSTRLEGPAWTEDRLDSTGVGEKGVRLAAVNWPPI